MKVLEEGYYCTCHIVNDVRACAVVNHQQHCFSEYVKIHWIKGAVNKGQITDILSKKWLTAMEDYVLCESHRDKMEYFLRNNG